MNYLSKTIAVSLFLAASVCQAQISLTPEGYFEGPGFNFLVYHNNFIGGRQGGLQMLLHGTRVLDSGSVFCRTSDGQLYGYYDNNGKKIGDRVVIVEENTCTIPGEFSALDLKYNLVVRTDGPAIQITVKLDKPVDWDKITEFVFKIEIFPEAYFNKIYSGGGITDYFLERLMSRTSLIPAANKILIAPEDPLLAMTIRANSAELSLRDDRRNHLVSGYMVCASLPPNSQKKEFSVTITPKLNPTWRRKPVIQVSQVGYHPAQQKTAVLELDSRITDIEKMELLHLDNSGIIGSVKMGVPVKWGNLFDYKYYIFDFTEVMRPGLYYLRYQNEQVGPFRIGTEVYKEAWHPTMDVFFPVQMCHVKVRDFLIVWHGACHVEDALQAPPNKAVIDGYHQGPETETKFKTNEHVPGLGWGGWHDAGDFDLASGAIAGTVLWIALAQELFDVDRDVTSIQKSQQLVELSESDSRNDMLQQAAYGIEFLLGLYRNVGHICAGVIANTGPDYGRVGDPTSITDGFIYDPDLGPEERKDGYSGKFDDRWVFTNRNTGGQYQFTQVAAICSRILREYDSELSEECLRAAEEVWEYEQTHEPVNFSVAYQPQEDQFHSLELSAAVELYLTTGKDKYKDRLLALTPSIEQMPALTFGHGVGFTLVRVLPKVENEVLKKAIREKSKEYRAAIELEFAKSPYGVYLHFGIWGNNWDVLQQTARLYFFIRHFPDLFDPEDLYSGLHYNFGCHPATNHSYVSGVGAKSATIGYGFNRKDTTYIPGGVVSGASLILPKFPEYRERPWDYYQTEYVIQGSAAYVFDVLAADSLLNQVPPAR
ncbi:MAG: glycoside hydrolase family 9 protein [bacterium]